MFDWMNPLVFTQTLIRVFLVWSAFHFLGLILEKPLRIKKLFPLIPRELTGILGFMLLAILLSLFGIMNRTVTPVILMLAGIPGLFVLLLKLYKTLKNAHFSWYYCISVFFLILITLVNLTYASMPNLPFDDPLVTYAVQPDRWLNHGGIHWLEDTAFSGFPLTYEMISIWPASISSDRMDQLSVLQVFQMTMLLAALFRGTQLMEIRRKLRIPLIITVLSCGLVYYWSSLAKTDTAAVLFSTLALASVFRELKDRTIRPFTSWLFMGMALATKQTAILVLVPFLIYGIFRLWKTPWSTKLTAVAILALLPAAFAVRTMLKTGSPTYPVYSISSMTRDEWKLLPIPEDIAQLQDRSSELHPESDYSVAKHVGIFLTSMEGILLLFAAGFLLSVFTRNGDVNRILFLPLITYLIIAIIAFWPPWWGAKYSILVYPFAALLGTRALQSRGTLSVIFLSFTCIVSLTVPGFVISPSASFPGMYRYTVTKSILQGHWETGPGYKMYPSSPEGMTHMWLNSFITEPAVILSLHEEKRYFCDFPVYVGWRHPATQYLYLDNSLEDECSILDELGVDYVIFYRTDPGIFNMENNILILDHIGMNDILEPLAMISQDLLVCRYNSPWAGN